MINYDNRTFRAINNSANGEVSEATIFEYRQNSFMVSATYSGGPVVFETSYWHC